MSEKPQAVWRHDVNQVNQQIQEYFSGRYSDKTEKKKLLEDCTLLFDFKMLALVHLHVLLPRVTDKELLAEIQRRIAASEQFRKGIDAVREEQTRNLNDLSGEQFEMYVARLLEFLGLHVEKTRPSGDGGVDIFATLSHNVAGGLYIVQCKRSSSPVGVEPIKLFWATLDDERAVKGLIVTNATFTSPAVRWAQGRGRIDLVDGTELQRWRAAFLASLTGTKPSK